jgi:hypothetical protein
MRRASLLVDVLAFTGCDTSRAPATPAPAVGGTLTITQLSIMGLPDPIIFDVPAAVAAGRTYQVGARATLEDGSTADVKPDALQWTSSDASVVTVSGRDLVAHGEGTATITLALPGTPVMTSREVTVYVPGTVREARAERANCPATRECTYPFCPQVGPYWLFAVHDSGTIELQSVGNPGWGSPSNYVVQLSRTGEYVRSWLLLRGNPEYRSATVPGGFMYVFIMSADLGPCGDVSAVWTHPQ